MGEPAVAARWRSYRFDEMASMVNDRVDNPHEAGVERYVGLEHLDRESLRIRRWGAPTDVNATKLLFRKGDIIFGRRRVYQRKVAVAHFDGICSAHAMVLRAKPDVVLAEFLPFLMQSDMFMERAKEISVGSLSPTINWKTLAKEEFGLPPLDEQRRIASAMSAADDQGEAIRRGADHLVGTATAHLLSIERDSSFKLTRLGDVLAGIEVGQSLPGSDVSPRDGEFGVLKVSAVDQWRFRSDEAKVLLDQTQFDATRQVRGGDLLMTRANTSDLVAKACLVENDYPNLMLSDKTWRLLPHADFDSTMLWYLLQAPGVRRQIKAAATGSGAAMKNVSQAKLKRIVISCPIVPENVNQVLSAAQGLRNGMRMVAERRRRSAELRARILNRLLTGDPE
jgi:type I restriction enzyme S subunit